MTDYALTLTDVTGRGLGPASIALLPGEIAGLVGPAGAGKTRLLRVAAGAGGGGKGGGRGGGGRGTGAPAPPPLRDPGRHPPLPPPLPPPGGLSDFPPPPYAA